MEVRTTNLMSNELGYQVVQRNGKEVHRAKEHTTAERQLDVACRCKLI